MALPEPLCGEVWDVAFPGPGVHPAVVLSVNALNSRLGHVVVLPVTGTSGPSLTHIPLGADAGPHVDVTGVQAVARGRCRRRRGLLAPSEMSRIEGQLRVYLGL